MAPYQRSIPDLLDKTRSYFNAAVWRVNSQIPRDGTHERDNQRSIDNLAVCVRALESTIRTMLAERAVAARRERMNEILRQKQTKREFGSFSWLG